VGAIEDAAAVQDNEENVDGEMSTQTTAVEHEDEPTTAENPTQDNKTNNSTVDTTSEEELVDYVTEEDINNTVLESGGADSSLTSTEIATASNEAIGNDSNEPKNEE
jgi:hypothetical protein